MAEALQNDVIERNRRWAEEAASKAVWQKPTNPHPLHTVAAEDANSQLAAAIKRNGG